MVIDHNGKVGIGTASPRRHLHINGGNESTKIQITNQTTGSGTDGEGFQLGIATDGTANLEQRENAAMVLSTNNTERVRIHSSGRFGIGTSGNTIQGSLVVKDVTDHNGSDVFVVAQNGNASRVAGYKVFDEGGTASLEMKYDNGSNTATIRNPNNGNLSIYLGGTGSANQLDDYEEGAWVPTLKNEGNNNLSVGYVSAYTHGRYVKIGPIVHFQMTVNINSLSGDSSQVLVCNNMPFVAKTYQTNSNGGAKVTYWNALDQDMTHALVLGNSANMRFRYSNNNFQSQHLQTNSWFQCYGQYETAL